MAANDLVLVTGASGFIAKHCIAELLKSGYRVRGSVRRPEAASEVTAAVAKLVEPAGRLEFIPLDLLSDAGWDEALRGCKYLMHVASPNPIAFPKDPDELIRPAREGTLRALRAAAAAGVARAAVTSTLFAVTGGHPPGWKEIYSEDDWADTESPRLTPYARSKTLAEHAAWDFAAQHPQLELVTVCPGFTAGPALDRDIAATTQAVKLMMDGKYPAVPRWGVAVADVRDVAAMHVAVLDAPVGAGQRFICAVDSMRLLDMSRTLAEHFPDYRRRLPTRELPNFLVRLAARFDRTLKNVSSELGEVARVSNEKAQRMLGFRFRSAEEALVSAAQSLIDLGLVQPPKRK
jgi:dihydroflavonol-4-reductase